jgi:DNA-binding response OmpR family regulator
MLCLHRKRIQDWKTQLAHILIAEDQPDIAKVTQTLLKAWGHDVTIARNGLEAMAAHAAGGIDLMLVDVKMPLIDGITVTRQVSSDLPVVGFTACADAGTREKLLEAGAKTVLVKPFDNIELKAVIEAWLLPHRPL